jgi:hypothetical protein
MNTVSPRELSPPSYGPTFLFWTHHKLKKKKMKKKKKKKRHEPEN